MIQPAALPATNPMEAPYTHVMGHACQSRSQSRGIGIAPEFIYVEVEVRDEVRVEVEVRNKVREMKLELKWKLEIKLES